MRTIVDFHIRLREQRSPRILFCLFGFYRASDEIEIYPMGQDKAENIFQPSFKSVSGVFFP